MGQGESPENKKVPHLTWVVSGDEVRVLTGYSRGECGSTGPDHDPNRILGLVPSLSVTLTEGLTGNIERRFPVRETTSPVRF